MRAMGLSNTDARWRRTLRSNWAYGIALVLLVILPHLVGWITGDSPLARRGLSVYWQQIVIEVFILAILAMSYNLLFGFTGVISFGHALFFGMGAYSLGMVMEKTGLPLEVGLPLGIIAAILVCAILGFAVGLVSLRLHGVYFAMFTLAIAEMFFIFFVRFSLTGAEDGFTLKTFPVWLDPSHSRLNFYYLALALFVLTFLFVRRLMHSPTGAVLLAIRENEPRARAIGYNTLTFKLLAITLAAVLASVAGMLTVMMNQKVGPEMLGISYTVDPLLMTIIGGIGTFSGPVIGAAGLHLIDRQIRDLKFTVSSLTINIGESWALILGIIFILTVVIFPQGIVGTLSRLHWRKRS